MEPTQAKPVKQRRGPTAVKAVNMLLSVMANTQSTGTKA
jgi:hypothetical protein